MGKYRAHVRCFKDKAVYLEECGHQVNASGYMEDYEKFKRKANASMAWKLKCHECKRSLKEEETALIAVCLELESRESPKEPKKKPKVQLV